MDLGLAGRALLLTGASSGLGLATARALVAEGARVTITGRDVEKINLAVKGLGNAAAGVAADNRDRNATTAAVDAAVAHGGGALHGLLVSVGGPAPAPAIEVDDETWRQQFDTLVVGAFRLVRMVLRHLSPGSAIGLVLSSSVRNPIAGLGVSNVLRPALAMAVKALADELGPAGVRVVGMVPGMILTARTQELREMHSDQDPADAVALRRLGNPDEFGRVAAFALSPAASYMTGCLVTVDGGVARSL